jgi:hypothetical protein
VLDDEAVPIEAGVPGKVHLAQVCAGRGDEVGGDDDIDGQRGFAALRDAGHHGASDGRNIDRQERADFW